MFVGMAGRGSWPPLCVLFVPSLLSFVALESFVLGDLFLLQSFAALLFCGVFYFAAIFVAIYRFCWLRPIAHQRTMRRAQEMEVM